MLCFSFCCSVPSSRRGHRSRPLFVPCFRTRKGLTKDTWLQDARSWDATLRTASRLSQFFAFVAVVHLRLFISPAVEQFFSFLRLPSPHVSLVCLSSIRSRSAMSRSQRSGCTGFGFPLNSLCSPPCSPPIAVMAPTMIPMGIMASHGAMSPSACLCRTWHSTTSLVFQIRLS